MEGKNNKNKKTILVVEDNESLGKIIRLKLEGARYNTSLAENAEAAKESIKNSLPDLIWLDIYLPGMNGLDFLKELRDNPQTKNIKVVVVSVSGSNKKIESAQKLGVSDYFIKSNYKIDELIEKVSIYL